MENQSNEPWSSQEETTLCKGWIDTSENNVEGIAKKSQWFWTEVLEAADLEDVEVQKVRPTRDKAKKKGASSFVRSESSTTGTPALIDQLVHKWTNAASEHASRGQVKLERMTLAQAKKCEQERLIDKNLS
ncbi:hypothetical protein Tco_0981659 [Tanacetum coccineum]